jgi:DNA helicase-2/ATP-dependent DNA helicase PcrA
MTPITHPRGVPKQSRKKSTRRIFQLTDLRMRRGKNPANFLRTMSLSLEKLNNRQKDAVLHGNGPLLILAGAGSGKTSTMAYRIAHLVSVRNVPPTAVLGLSFTNKAATELKERVTKLIKSVSGPRSARGLTVTTFHSLCVRMIRAYGQHLGFQPNFTIIDRNDQKDILKQIFRTVKIDDRKFDLDTILFEFGQVKSRLWTPEEAEAYFLSTKRLAGDYGIAAASAYPKYQDQLKALNAMDFDDLLYYGVRLLETHQDTREHYNALFRHILVDEYQDTNPTQFRLLQLLTQRQQNLCVVGDDDQSIYSWRGADPTHILEFSHHYPAAKTITLDQNYRSTQTILDAANHVIKNNTKRHAKSLWSDKGMGAALTEVIVEDDRAEGEFVAQEMTRIKHEQNYPWKDFAVLYRSNAQARIFEEAFRRNMIPYKIVGGYSFLDLKEVKDVLSYWRLIVNQADDPSLRRILNWPARGIGKSSIEALGDYAFKKEMPIFEALAHHAEWAGKSAKAAAGAEAFHALITKLKTELENLPTDLPLPQAVVNWAKRSLEVAGVRGAVEAECEDPIQAVKKWENVEELLHSLGQVDGEGLETGPARLQEFLNRMALDAQNEEEEEKDDNPNADEVTLLTLHGAKGLEFPIVFMVGMEEGYLPHKRTIDEAVDFGEERRLCYVGITRAKTTLLLIRARNRVRYGKKVPRNRSRFMQEIPESLLIRRDESFGPDDSDSDEAKKQHEDKVKDYLSNIRAMLQNGAT